MPEYFFIILSYTKMRHKGDMMQVSLQALTINKQLHMIFPIVHVKFKSTLMEPGVIS